MRGNNSALSDSGLIDKLTSDEKAIRVRAFYGILNGKPYNVEELASQVGLTEEQVQMSVKSLVHKGMLVIDSSGTIVGSHGLSLIPTGHQLNINDRDLFTWCAIDAVGIPAALGSDAKIASKCYQCNDPISITMSQGEIQHFSSKGIRVWVVEIDIGRSIVGCA